MSAPTVQVAEGKLKGTICENDNNFKYYAFKGVPYAKPPVGDLRFADPSPPEPWQGTRDASENPNIAPQIDYDSKKVVGNEDCLYLNVFIPKLPRKGSKLLPVMVFLHPGGFFCWSGTDDTKQGPGYLVENDVIVVGLNYRLGIFGFLNLDIKEAPGNMGLKDQVEALRWVKKNIAAFGGDANNVTIFGMSAGGSSVEYLLLSPMAKGLFHKAIAESGSSLCHWAITKDSRKLAQEILKLKGKIITNFDDLEVYKYFKSLSADELIELTEKAKGNCTHGGLYFGFVPSIEKPNGWEPFIDRNPISLLKSGSFTRVPFLAGFNSHEGFEMIHDESTTVEKVSQNKNVIDYLPFKIDETEKAEVEKSLKALYFNGNTTNEEDSVLDFFGDIDFNAPINEAITLISKKNPDVYYYEFSYDGNRNFMKTLFEINKPGSGHCDEMGYIFETKGLYTNATSASDERMLKIIVKMWTNFAKYGQPTPTTDELLPVKWEPISELGVQHFRIDNDMKMVKGAPYPDRMAFYEKLYEKE